MNVKAIIMNKQILLALGMIVFIGAVVASSTGAFFTSNASATGNTFAAGTMELKIAQNSGAGTPTGGWLDTQVSPLSFSEMAPGGDPSEGAVWLKNEGSIDGMTVGVEMNNASESVAGMGPLMRITQMDLDGESLLEGGAGANIPEYELAYNCDIEVNFGNNDYNKITDAISNAGSGDVICVGDGNYNSAWEGPNTIAVDEEVTIASVNGPDTTQTIPFDVEADNVTIAGFDISRADGTYGVRVIDKSDVTVASNHIHNIGTSLTGTENVQAIYVHGNNVQMSNFVFRDNKIENIGSLTQNGSNKGIYVGDTAGAGGIMANITIENNIINGIYASTNPWVSGGSNSGKGAYGVLFNYGNKVSGSRMQNITIQNNTVNNIEGLWAHALGMEGATQNTSITLNEITNVTDHKAGDADAVAVFFEDNNYANTVTVNQNDFDVNTELAIAVHPAMSNNYGTIDATNNWWGDFDPSDQIFENNGNIDTANFAGGSFAGFVNGNDGNGNGYADFQDLNNDPIIAAEIGLDAGEEKLFELGVQLDGPNTSNTYQGADYETDFVFTLNQI